MGDTGSYTKWLVENDPAYEAVGGKIDIHKGKLPRPKAGFTPSKYKYMGPYNPLISSWNMIPIQEKYLNGMFNSTIKWMK